MPLTRVSLLFRIRNLSSLQDWEEFVRLYSPIIERTARRCRLQDEDIADVKQEVLLQMMRTIGRFEKDGSKGKFRSYLARITVNKIRDTFRQPSRRIGQLEDPSLVVAEPVPEEIWDDEVNRRAFQLAVEKVRLQSKAVTWKCFAQHVLKERKASEVASDLGVSENAVFVNCSRTLSRIRESAGNMKRDGSRYF